MKKLYEFFLQHAKNECVYFDDKEVIPFQIEWTGLLERELSLKQMEEDRNELFRLLESIHPLFLIGPSKEYLSAKDEYTTSTSKPMNIAWFERATNHFLSCLKDKHTQLFWMRDDEYLQCEIRYCNGKMYYENEKSPIKNISNIDAERIIREVQYIFAYENRWMLHHHISFFAKSKRILQYCGEVFDAPEIELENGQRISCNWGERVTFQDEKNWIKVREDGCYIHFGQCVCNKEWKDILSILKEELEKGKRNVIVDIRGNGGGYSGACMDLLVAMGMKVKGFGVLMRFSKEASDQRGFVPETGYLAQNNLGEFVRNPSVNLELWLDEVVFSSANMLAVWVADGKLGKLRGVPSMNRPSSFGDPIEFQLPNSLARGFISHKAFWRMDESRMLDDELIIEAGITNEDNI